MNMDRYEMYLTEAIGTAGFFVAAIAFIIFIAIVVVILIGQCLLFKKCGQAAWKAIIPFYSKYVFFVEICGLHWAWFAGWMAVTFFSVENVVVSVLKLFVYAMAFYNLALRCGKDRIPSMIFGGIFPSIVTIVYGLSNLLYNKEVEVKDSGVF